MCYNTALCSVVKNGDFQKQTQNWEIKGCKASFNDKRLILECSNSKTTLQQTIKTAVDWKSYEVILQMKTSGRISAELYFIKQLKPWTTYFKKEIGNLNAKLSTYKYTFTPKPTDKKENAVFRIVFKGKGKVELKSICINRVSAQKNEHKNTGENLLSGSGFELGDRYYTVGWSGYTREFGGYQNIPEYSRAENGSNSGRKYNEDDKIEGKQSLHLIHDYNYIATTLFSSPVISETARDNQVIFSVYMKSISGTPKIDLRIRSGKFGEKPIVSKKTFTLNDKWERYFIRGKIGQQGQGIITFKGKGNILIDAAMLEYRDKSGPSKYKAGDKFDCFVESSALFGVSLEKSQQKLTLHTLNRQKPKGKLEASIKISDYYSKTVNNFKVKLKNKIFKQAQVLQTSKLPVGYYKVRCEILLNGKKQICRENAIVVVPNRDISKFTDNAFGMHSSLLKNNLKLMKILGISMIRTHLGMETKWQVLEPQKGRIQNIEDIFEVCAKQKMNILGSLDYTPLWASTIKADFPSLKRFNMPRDLGYYARLFPATDFNDTLRYVKRTVSKYKKYIKYWETWNEVRLIDKVSDRIKKPIKSGFIHLTLDELLSKSKKIYSAVKQANPGAVVVGQYACHAPYEQLDKIIQAGGTKYIDKLAVHFYQGLGKGTPPDEPSNKGYKPLREQTAKWRKLMKKSGKIVGLWDSEFGICRIKTNYNHWKYLINWEGCNAKRTVAYLVKSYLVRMSLGYEKIFYYSFSRPAYKYDYNPFIEFDCRPQPSMAALAVMTKYFSNVNFSKDPVDDKYCHIIKGKNKDNYIYAVWLKSEGSNLDLKLNKNEKMKVINVMGRAIEKYPVKITQEPVYILSKAEIDEVLLASYKASLSGRKHKLRQKKQQTTQPDIVNTGIDQ